jgi:hypothetical protein
MWGTAVADNTSDLHIVSIEIQTFVPPWRKGLQLAQMKVVSSVSSQELTSCFMLVTATYCLLAK